jgi:hypothetical protein
MFSGSSYMPYWHACNVLNTNKFLKSDDLLTKERNPFGGRYPHSDKPWMKCFEIHMTCHSYDSHVDVHTLTEKTVNLKKLF